MNLDILPKKQKLLWSKLAGASSLGEFYLAGGTAIALHLGHRESIDFDFFTPSALERDALLFDLKKLGKPKILSEDENTLHCQLGGVMLSFFCYPHPLIVPGRNLDGIFIADIADLVAMKLIAVSHRGAKKDFIDIHAIYKSGWNLSAMLETLKKKFPKVEYNQMHIIRSLSYFEDADLEPMPKMLKKITWNEVKDDLSAACDLNKIL